MSIPQETNAVFYHPLDDTVESTQSEAWRGRSAHAAGTVADAMAPLPGGFELGSTDNDTTGDYATIVAAVPLTETTACVVWADGSVTLRAAVCTVTDGLVSVGSSVSWSWSGDFSVAGLDATTVVVMHNRGGANGVGRVLAVAGADVTLGPEQSCFPAGYANSSSVRLDSTRFVTVFSVTTTLYAAVGTVTGADITFGTPATGFGSYNGGAILLDSLAPDKFVAGWAASSSTYMAVGTIAGPFDNTVTLGAATTFSAGFGAQIDALAALDSETYVVYSDGTGWTVCRVDGYSITIGPDQGNPEGNPEGHPVMRRTSADSALLLQNDGERMMVLRTDGYLMEWGDIQVIQSPGPSGASAGLAVLTQEVALVAGTSSTGYTFLNAVALQGNAEYSRPYGFWGEGPSSPVHDGYDIPSTAKQVRLRRIDDDRAIAAYAGVGGSYSGYLRAGAVGWGGAVAWGAAAQLDGGVHGCRVAMLGTDLAVACWKGVGAGIDGHGVAQVLSVSGNTVSPGGVPVAYYWTDPSGWDPWGVEALGTASFAVVWRHNTSGGMVTVGTVSGGSITFGSAATFAADVTNAWTAPIDSTRIAIFYNTDSGFAQGLVATLSGTEMTFGTPVPLAAANASNLRAVPLGGDAMAVAYVENPGDGEPTKLRVATTPGAAMTLGPVAQPVDSTYSSQMDIAAVDGGFAVVCRDADRSNQFWGRPCRVAGDQIALGAEAEVGGFFHLETGNGEDWLTGLDGETLVALEEDAYDLLSNTVRSAYDEYPTAAADAPAGPAQEFGTPYTNINDLLAVAMLDATRVAVAYGDQGDGYKGKMMIGELSGQDIAWGAPVEFEAASLFVEDKAAILGLDATTVVVAWESSSAVMGRVATVAGTGAVFPASATTLVSSISEWDAAATTSTEFVLAYRSASGTTKGNSRIKTVSGYDITGAAETPFLPGGDASWISIAALDSTRVILAYQDVTDSGHGTVKVGSTSGGDMSWGPEAEFLPATSAARISVAALSPSKFIVAFEDQSDSNHGKAVVGGVGAGTAISGLGSPTVFHAAVTQPYIRVAALDAAHAIVAYTDNSVIAKARAGAVSGNDIAWGPEFDFYTTPSELGSLALSAADASTAVVAYRDGADSGRGKVKVLLPFAGGVGPFPKLAFSSWYRGGGPIPPPPTTTIPPTTVPPTTTTVPPVDSISYGSSAAVTPSAVEHMGPSIVKFDSTRMVVCYTKAGTIDGVARVATVSGADITFGPEGTWGPGTATGDGRGGTSVTVVDSTRVVAAFASDLQTWVAVGTVTGTSIAFGTAASAGAYAGTYGAISVVHMDLGKVIVFHNGNVSKLGAVMAGTVSGTDITIAASYAAASAQPANVKVVKLNSSRFVLVWHQQNQVLLGRVAEVGSGTVVTFLTSIAQVGDNGAYIPVQDHDIACGSCLAVAAISATQFIVAFADNGSLSDHSIRVKVGTFAAPNPIAMGSTTYPLGNGGPNCKASSAAFAMLDSTTVALCVQMDGTCVSTSGYGVAKIGDIVAGPTVSWRDGTGLDSGFEFVGLAGHGRMLAAAEVDSARFVPFWIHYASPGDDLGSAAVGTVT